MVTLFYSREGLSSKQKSAFDFVLANLPTKSTFNLDDLKILTSGESKESKTSPLSASTEALQGNANIFLLGSGSRLLNALSSLSIKHDSEGISVIRELTWNAPPGCREWSISELPFRMIPAGVAGPGGGIYLIPRCMEVDPFFSSMNTAVPKWEEALSKGKCHKAVLCSVKDTDNGPRWNIMRSMERLQHPPYQIPSRVHDFLNESTIKYAPFFPVETWSTANHVWLERMKVSYCSMGFHSDRRLDLSGDIRVYTGYSSTARGLQMPPGDISPLFDREQMAELLAQPGMRCLDVRRKSSKSREKEWSIPMPAGSLLIISAVANTCLQHAICGQPDFRRADDQAMVLTYRYSNTWLQLDDQKRARLQNGKTLENIRGDEKSRDWKKWMSLCREDNSNVDDPFLIDSAASAWCVSPADLLPPIQLTDPKGNGQTKLGNANTFDASSRETKAKYGD